MKKMMILALVLLAMGSITLPRNTCPEGMDRTYRGKEDLQGHDFSGQTLKNHDFSGSNAKSADFQEADLANSCFAGTQLQRAKFNDATLTGVNLVGAQLQGADFEGADLSNTNLNAAQLGGANLRGANLRGAKNIKAAVFFNAAEKKDDVVLFEDAKYGKADLSGATWIDGRTCGEGSLSDDQGRAVCK